jgi:diaminopimelate decarboxylase
LKVNEDHVSENPVAWSLLPKTASVGEEGELTIGGVSVEALTSRFGTPLFIYDEAHLRERCREAVAAFGPDVAYASKAFLCTAMAKLAHEEGMRIDVSTAGELHVALAANVPGDRLVLHGNNKSVEELTMALDAGVGRIIVDSFDELHRLEQLARSRAATISVWIRITPGVHAHTHAFISTGQEDSKFGFSVNSGAAHAAVRVLEASPNLELVGIHAHLGSQVFDLDNFAQAAKVVGEFFAPLGLAELCLGGGLGEAYVNGEETQSLEQWANATREALLSVGVSPEVTVSAEPGRSIVARAAVTAYTVGTIKDLPDLRTYVSVDGGMSDNPRPVLYGSGYETLLARAPRANRPRHIRLVGKHCESGDVLVADGTVPSDLAIGDVLVTPVTGAYGYSMASNYNKVPRPAVVFVASGEARLVVRRESLDDLLALDVG